MKTDRKKGSALVLVLISISVLSILGMALISLAASNYKYRMVKGEVKKSLYASEAGIDESYRIINDIMNDSVEFGNTEVDKFTKIEMNKEIVKEKQKEVEKKKRLKNGETFSDEEWKEIWTQWDAAHIGSEFIEVKDDGTFDVTLLEKQQTIEFDKYFKEYMIKKIIKENSSPCVLNGVYNKLDDKNAEVIVKNGRDFKFVDDKKQSKLNIQLESTFINKDGIKKVISAEYDIIAPKYGQNYSVAANTIKIPNMVWSKAIAVDGNMYINPEKSNEPVDEEVKKISILNIGEESKLSDIYVKGKPMDENGIIIDSNSRPINIYGNVITGQDFLLVKKSNCTVYGNIYAKNVKVGKNDDKLRLQANGSIFKIDKSGSIYTSDDLELNSNSSEIDINGNFYGIDGESWINKEADGTSNKSSTIIINSDDLGKNSKLNIEGETIISGVGFIDGLKDPDSNEFTEYKTGESVCIKGNYKAYTNSLNEEKLNLSDKNYAKVELKQLDPLILAWRMEGANRQLTSEEKSKYFELYHEQNKGEELNKDESGLNFNGVVLKGETKSAGIVISEGKIKSKGSIIDDDKNIIPSIVGKKNHFNKMVNNMGVSIKKNSKYLDTPNNIFGKGEKCKVNINKLKNTEKLSGETLIYIKKDAGNCTLDFDLTNYSNVRKGIIIVDGNLTIKGSVNFTGSIIVSGDLTIIGSKNETVNIKSDKNYLRGLIIQNYFDLFEGVFKNDNDDNDESVYDIQLNANYGSDVNKDNFIKYSELIKLKNWKINK